MRKRSVCFVVASEMTVKSFLVEPLRVLEEHFTLTVVVNIADPDSLLACGVKARFVPIGIERAVRVWSDLKSLLFLWRLFHRERFDIVHSVTPKAGLLAMLAGRLAGVRVRIHTFTGQVWATRRGFSRRFLKTMDKILVSCATHLLADSPSQRQFLIAEGVVSAARIDVLGQGSISGVDVVRFAPDNAARMEIRDGLHLSNDALLFLFLGRLNREKGVLDLALAFARIAGKYPHVHLLFVGPDEADMEKEIEQICADCRDRVHRIGYTDTPQRYMAAADVFCLPSYREGFGSVIIEAAATGIPAIGSRIYGVTDAIVENETGLLFPPHDVAALAGAMEKLASDKALRVSLGHSARERALRIFSSKKVIDAWRDFYARLDETAV